MLCVLRDTKKTQKCVSLVRVVWTQSETAVEKRKKTAKKPTNCSLFQLWVGSRSFPDRG